MLTRTSVFRACLLLTAGAVTALGAADPAWKHQPAPAWAEEDARQILTDSPWAKTIRAMIIPMQTEDERREGGNMGQEHGVGFDGIASVITSKAAIRYHFKSGQWK